MGRTKTSGGGIANKYVNPGSQSPASSEVSNSSSATSAESRIKEVLKELYYLIHQVQVSIPTLKAQITTKVVCLSRLLKCLRSLYGKQCGPRSDCSYPESMLFASILNLSVMLGNYLQQTTSADDIFRCIFYWCFKG